MDRLFLTVYSKILAAFIVALFLTALAMIPEGNSRAERNFETQLAGPAGMVSELLAREHARGRDLDAAFEEIDPRFRTMSALVNESDLGLNADASARLERGELVRTSDFPRSVFYSRIKGANRVLKVGPLQLVNPVGGGRIFRGLAIVFVGLMVGVYFVLRPVRNRLAALSRAARDLGQGDLRARATDEQRDAIGDLSRQFNGMADQLTRQIAAQQELLHMVSHELRTPLQRMRFNAEALRTTDEPRREEVLKRFDRDVDELDDLLAELLTYVRLGNHAVIAPQEVDMQALVEDLCEAHGDAKGRVDLAVRAHAPLLAAIDSRLVRRAVSNLVVNALAYARERVELSVTRTDDAITIQVDDDGGGIAPDARERVFQPFQRLDDERKSFGLGLAIVRRVAELHGGSATASDSDLGGACLRIVLPALPPTAT